MPDGERLLVTWYGDDMTGSVDVLEGLLRFGIRGALFIDAPTESQLSQLTGVSAVGVSGMTRTLPSGRIPDALGPALVRLAALGAPILLYKICSTFDSTTEVGSIGAALETIETTLEPQFQALLPAAPSLGRFTAFANHFATSGGSEVSRLDRHPTMRSHPVTPMSEADLRLILAEQTSLRVGHLDLRTVGAGTARARSALAEEVDGGAAAVLFDAVDDAQMRTIGELLWAEALASPPLPVVGSAGVVHALGSHWRASGLIADGSSVPAAKPSGPIVAVAGSRSPVTDSQLARAVADGFTELAAPLADLLSDDADVERRLAETAGDSLAAGRSVVIHSAGAPVASGAAPEPLDNQARRRLGERLGAICEAILLRTPVERLAIAGGDTSGDVVRRLGVVAIEALAPFGPAMPLCRLIAPGRSADGLEAVFKGGQTGTVDFFPEVREGVSAIRKGREVGEGGPET
jgi:uncharacterized protein YgbK (DUF1537 family)